MSTANWHRYVIAVGTAALVVVTGIETGQIPVPPAWVGVLVYLPLVIGVLHALLPSATENKSTPPQG